MKKIVLILAILAIVATDVLADPPVSWRSFPPPTSWCVYAPERGECYRQFSCGVTRFMYACGVVKCSSYGDKACDDGNSGTYDWCQNPGKKATCNDQTQASCAYTGCPPYTHDANDNPSDGCEAQLFDYTATFNQTYAKILAGDPITPLLTIARTDVGGQPAVVTITPTVSPGGISEDSVIVELLDPITKAAKDNCKPENSCSLLANLKTSFTFAKPNTTTYKIDVVAKGSDKSHGATTPFTLDVVGCNNNNKCESPERDVRCPYDCALSACAKTSAVTINTTFSGTVTGRGSKAEFDVIIDVTDCGKRDVELYLKKLPPEDWVFKFDCGSAPSCTISGKTVKLKDVEGTRKVKLTLEIPKSASAGKYSVQIGAK